MGANDNPSVVNDASGNNYGGIGGGMQDAQMQYIENLQKLAMKATPKALPNSSYFPGEGQGPQIGSYSGSVVGNVPIFASTDLFPFAMIDAQKNAKAEAEAEYYNKIKPYMDKPLIDASMKLNNVWAQPEFASKLQSIADLTVEKYAARNGGNYMMARIAASQDKDFNRTLARAGQYAGIYNDVFKSASETLVKAADPTNFYVSPAEKQSAIEFIHAHDSLDKLSIDELARKGEQYQAKESIFKLATAATTSIQQDVIDSYQKDPLMSTDQENVWVKTKTTGYKDQADKIFENILKSQPWLQNDEVQRNLLKTEINNKVKYGVEKSIEKIKADNADRDLELQKYGIKQDPQGDIQFGTKPAALVNTQGQNVVNYRTEGSRPIASVVGMTGYIVNNGKLRFVKLPESYQMLPQSEYDITDASSGVSRGRYVESKMDFQSVGPYKPDDTRALTSAKTGTVTPYSLGTDRGSEEKLPASLVDAVTGEQIQVYGEQTILLPFDQAKGIVESNVPYMGYVHDKLEASYGPYTKRKENLDKGGNELNKKATYATPIEVPAGADSSFFKDDPFTKYHWRGKILTGKEAWDIIGR